MNNDSKNYIRSVNGWIPIPGSIEAIARLYKAGYTIAIATNQSGLARGYFSEAELQSMHNKFLLLVEKSGGKVAAIKYCPHHPDQNCNCRKPKPGMLIEIINELGAQAETTWMVGDSFKDLQAGRLAGCKTALVKTGNGTITLAAKRKELDKTPVFENLSMFCDQLLSAGY